MSLVLAAATVTNAQYVATAQQGVPYPSLTSPSPISLTAPGTNDPADRGRATLPLGFTVPFYGRSYTAITVSANGLAFFEPSTGANSTSDFPTNSLPSAAEPNGVLAVLWDDLIGNNATSVLSKQAVSGSNGQGLAIEWKDWNRTFGQYSLTFQLRVWENGIIEYFYGPLSGAGSSMITASVGIEAPLGTVGVNALAGCTNDCSITSFDPAASGTPISYLRFGPPAGVDLQAVALSVNSISVNGTSLEVDSTVTVRNFGTQAVPTFTYRLLLSQDTIADDGDFVLNPTPQGPFALAALATVSNTVTASAPVPASGSWYVLAQLDAPNSVVETNEANNVLASAVPYSAMVDLVAQAVVPPAVAGPKDPVSISVQFANQGFTAAGPVDVKLLASLDATFSADDRLLDQRSIVVAGGQQVSSALTFAMPSSLAADDYYVLLQLDDGPAPGAIVEASDLNNLAASATRLQLRQADLVVTEVRVKQPFAPFSATAVAAFGEPLRLEALVSNQGGAKAPDVRVAFYLSDNETLNAISDPFIGELSGLSFAPGASQWVTLPNAVVPSTTVSNLPLQRQNYFFFAAATSAGLAENDGQNNAFKSSPVLVRTPAPNLVAVNVRAPDRIAAGEVISVECTLGNFGDLPAPATSYRYYLSSNAIITPDDVPLPIVSPGHSEEDVLARLVTLDAGTLETRAEQVRVPIGLPAATYFVGVLLDPTNSLDESSKSDNGLAAQSSALIAQTFTLATAALPDAVIGQPYALTLAAVGAPGPFSFTADLMPAGLSLNANGQLAGTPEVAGQFWLTFTITAANGQKAKSSRVLRVAASTGSLTLTTASLPAPVRTFAYTAQLGAAGGAAPYSFSLSAGALPMGVALEVSGAFSGVVTAAVSTTSTFAVKVTDSLGNVAEQAYSLTVVDGAPFMIQTASLAGASIGVEYLAGILAVNPKGTPVSRPVTWTLQEGTLPRGLRLEPSTTEQAVISGTPTQSGVYRLVLEAVDGQGRADWATYVLIVAPGEVAITGELASSTLAPGDSVSATFSLTPPQPDARFFVRDGRLPPGITLSSAGVLSGQVPSDTAAGSFVFTLAAGSSASELVALKPVALQVKVPTVVKQGCSTTPLTAVTWWALLSWWAPWRAIRRRRS